MIKRAFLPTVAVAVSLLMACAAGVGEECWDVPCQRGLICSPVTGRCEDPNPGTDAAAGTDATNPGTDAAPGTDSAIPGTDSATAGTDSATRSDSAMPGTDAAMPGTDAAASDGCVPAAMSTGFTSPTSTAAPNDFTNAANAFASDDLWATVAHMSGCRCPFVDLSWNGGVSYTSTDLLGPYGTTDSIDTGGGATDTWGHAWTPTELSNSNFRLRISNPSTLLKQGYADFGFAIPAGAIINGIEVRLEWHGDAGFTTEYLDHAEVNVHYTGCL